MMSENIRRVGRELKYKGAILDVYTDHMEFANGNTAEWDFIKHKGAAAVVPVTEDGKLVMVRQYRNALDRYMRKSRELSAREENWRKRPDIGATAWSG